MAKINVGIIFGGQSAEHEVSLQSARNIIEAIDRERFDVTLIGIDKQGHWHLNEQGDFLLHANEPANIALNASGRNIALLPGQAQQQVLEYKAQALTQLDVIFPIVHGTLGEDGSLQGLLKVLNLPFVGSQVLASAICMDKDICKRLLRDAGLNVAPYIKLSQANRDKIDFVQVQQQLGQPVFIKPANQGSSVGVSKVNTANEFEQAIEHAFLFDHKVLIEQAISGREIECAVLGNTHAQVSVCGEVVLSDAFYSYDTKYLNETGAVVQIPAQLCTEISDKIRMIALRAYEVVECRGLARVDVFLTEQNEVIINEINTLPGFTNISMYPKLWQESGLSYRDLISRLIELAIDEHRQQQQLQHSR